MPLIVLVATALRDRHEVRARRRSTTPGRRASPRRSTPTSSQANNNGSAFAGYTGYVQPNAHGNAGAFGITFADLLGGLAMLGGRFLPMLAALAVAGSLAGKRVAPAGLGHAAHRHADLRASCSSASSLIVALLTFVPALLLGPVVQGLTDQLF